MLGKDISKSEEESEEYVNEPTGSRDDTEGSRELIDLEATGAYLSHSKDKEKRIKAFVENCKEQLAYQRSDIDLLINEVKKLEKHKSKLEKKVLKLEGGKEIPASPHDAMEKTLPSEREHFSTHTSSVDSGDDDSTKDPYSFSQNPEVYMSGSMAAEKDNTMGRTEPSDLEDTAAYYTLLEKKKKMIIVSYEDIYELLLERRSEIKEVESKIELLRDDIFKFEDRIYNLEKSLPSSAFGRASGENVASERMSLTSTISEDSGFGVASKDD
ncbi:UNVERIFIED_CONTAM: hypothetical protein RMT77_015763 [Armadillidium vulgare]